MKGFLFPHPPILVNGGNEEALEVCSKTVESMKEMAKEWSSAKPDLNIYVTAHGPIFNDAIMIHPGGTLSGQLNDESYSISLRSDLVNVIQKKADAADIPVYKITERIIADFRLSEELDHGVMVPLSYAKDMQRVESLYISYGYLSPMTLYDFGSMLRQVVEEAGLNACIIASGDLSHCTKASGPYGLDERGIAFDQRYTKALQNSCIEELLFANTEGAMECGKRCVDILLGAYASEKLKINLLSYESPYGVGYACASFTAIPSNLRQRDALLSFQKNMSEQRKASEGPVVSFARRMIEDYLDGKDSQVLVDKLPEELKVFTRGSFVSIHDSNGLRGCMGNIGGHRTFLYEDVKQNAINAATNDPRFDELTREELDLVTISVDVLSKPETLATIEGHDPIKFGLIVENEETHGLLLPDLPGITHGEEQLKICLQKAGISPQSIYKMYKFTVERYF